MQTRNLGEIEMYDVSSKLQAYIDAQWSETNPAKANLKYAFDEFDPNKSLPQSSPQLLFENGIARTVWITRNIYRIEHECKITIFLRPVRYDSTTISNTRTTFVNTKKEIDRILNGGRFSITDLNWVELGTWKDEDIKIGFDTKPNQTEPIIFEASIIIKCFYYIGSYPA